MKQTNEMGMTLIELLVVIAILGIISAIAVIGFSTIIQKSKDDTFLANAYSLKKAAENYYYSSELVTRDSFTETITYSDLITSGFLNFFKDPDDNQMMPENGNESFVTIAKEANGSVTYRICYRGNIRKICGNNNNGILFEDLQLNQIEN